MLQGLRRILKPGKLNLSLQAAFPKLGISLGRLRDIHPSNTRCHNQDI
jgi:hypothetical protein